MVLGQGTAGVGERASRSFTPMVAGDWVQRDHKAFLSYAQIGSSTDMSGRMVGRFTFNT